jgi:3-hydroxyacyl-[acyl-carrier-protein] dehydratase
VTALPGVLQIEMLAQAAGVHAASRYALKGRRIYVVGFDNVRFGPPVRPGDTLRVVIELVRFGGAVAKVRGRGYVDDREVISADIIARVV